MTNHQLEILEKINLLILAAQQKQVASDMLKEADTLTTDDTEISDVGIHKMNYNCILKPRYKEIKDDVEDLLNRGWIVPSESDYSSPVVAVCKKDGTLRLCCDY